MKPLSNIVRWVAEIGEARRAIRDLGYKRGDTVPPADREQIGNYRKLIGLRIATLIALCGSVGALGVLGKRGLYENQRENPVMVDTYQDTKSDSIMGFHITEDFDISYDELAKVFKNDPSEMTGSFNGLIFIGIRAWNQTLDLDPQTDQQKKLATHYKQTCSPVIRTASETYRRLHSKRQCGTYLLATSAEQGHPFETEAANWLSRREIPFYFQYNLHVGIPEKRYLVSKNEEAENKKETEALHQHLSLTTDASNWLALADLSKGNNKEVSDGEVYDLVKGTDFGGTTNSSLEYLINTVLQKVIKGDESMDTTAKIIISHILQIANHHLIAAIISDQPDAKIIIEEEHNMQFLKDHHLFIGRFSYLFVRFMEVHPEVQKNPKLREAVTLIIEQPHRYINLLETY